MSPYRYRDPHVLKIRRSGDRLIFTMGIPIPKKDGLHIEMGPWLSVQQPRRILIIEPQIHHKFYITKTQLCVNISCYVMCMTIMQKAHRCPKRLLHSLSLVAIGLSVGYETYNMMTSSNVDISLTLTLQLCD